MKNSFVILLICMSQNVFGERIVCDDEKGRIIKRGDFALENRVYNWEYSVLENKLYKFEIKQSDTVFHFMMSNLLYEIFRINFNATVSKFDSKLNNKTSTYEEAAKIFIILKLIPEQINDNLAPIAGYLSIPTDSIAAYFYRDPKEELESQIKFQRSIIDYNIGNRSSMIENLNRAKTDSTMLLNRGLVTKKDSLVKNNIIQNIIYLNRGIDSISNIIDNYKKGLKSLFDTKRFLKRDIRKNTNLISSGYLYIDSIKTEFSEGALKNIITFGKLVYTEQNYGYQLPTQNYSVDSVFNNYSSKRISRNLMLRNYYPIPFASFRDYTASDVRLWEFPSLYSRQSNYIKMDWYVLFSDVIKYRPELAINQEDYSPRDQTKTFNAGSDQAIYKEVNSRLFRVKVFSDFIGVKDDNPNGLIQLELSKRIILNPRKNPITSYGRRPNYWFSGISYIEPIFSLSKIEENNKYLLLIPVNKSQNMFKVGEQIKSSVNILELYRYQNFSAGGNINLLSFDAPNAKSSLFVNIGPRLFRTAAIDSLRLWKKDTIITSNETKRFNINTFLISLEGGYVVKPDTRFGLQLITRASWLWVQNSNVIPINNLNLTINNQKSNQNIILTTQLDVFIRPSVLDDNKGEIFARLSYNNLLFNTKSNFMQIQVGYSFNLLKKD